MQKLGRFKDSRFVSFSSPMWIIALDRDGVESMLFHESTQSHQIQRGVCLRALQLHQIDDRWLTTEKSRIFLKLVLKFLLQDVKILGLDHQSNQWQVGVFDFKRGGFGSHGWFLKPKGA